MFNLFGKANMKHSNGSAQFYLYLKNQVSAHAKWRIRTLAMAIPLPWETLSEFSDTPTAAQSQTDLFLLW